MLPERIYHVCDTIVCLLGTTVTTAVVTILGTAHTRTYNPDDQLMQTLLPLIGVTFVGAGAILLNPKIETRPIVVGRTLIGAFFGLIGPSIAIAIAPNILPEWAIWVVDVMKWPMSLIGMGGVICGIAYILSRPFFNRAYERADAFSLAQLERLEKFAKGPNNTVVVLDSSRMSDSSKAITERIKKS